MRAPERVMTISRNGQVSVPAQARARWKTRKVIVVDLGDRVVMRPVSKQPAEQLRGKYRRRGVDSDGARTRQRQAEAGRERRR